MANRLTNETPANSQAHPIPLMRLAQVTLLLGLLVVPLTFAVIWPRYAPYLRAVPFFWAAGGPGLATAILGFMVLARGNWKSRCVAAAGMVAALCWLWGMLAWVTADMPD